MTNGSTPTTPEQLIFSRTDWRARLVREYEPVAQRLMTAYARLQQRLSPLEQELLRGMTRLNDAGLLTAENVRSLSQFQRFMLAAEREYQDFAVLVRNAAADAGEAGARLGGPAALDMSLATSGNFAPAVRAAWLQPSADVLNSMAGFVDSAAFQANWARYGEAAAQSFADVLLAGIAQGKHPRVLARLIANWYTMPYSWAENATRTAQLWSYRAASHATYRANAHILDGWIWMSAADPRTCISCWDQHGSVHPVTEELRDHHRGRCTAVPVVKGSGLSIPTGPALFEALPEAQQIEIMGPGMHEAWKRGDARWGDFSTPYQDSVYGTMLRAATLKELGVRAS